MSYDPYAQVVAISFLTNITNGIKATPSALQQMATQKTQFFLSDPDVTQYIGDWNIEWGPVIFCVNDKDTETYTNNSLLVTRKDTTYLVTVAGTNGKSLYDWVIEDFAVGVKIPWDEHDKKKGKIAKGTNIAFNYLLNMRDPVTNKTLFEFLPSVTVPIEKLIVAGHSLGGTLTPVLALRLENTKALWGGENAVIYAYPTAGATPGDEKFATYFRAVFPGDRYVAWKNRIDVVPHAWQESTLGELPGLYKPNIKPDVAIYSLVAIAQGKALLGNYTQIEGQNVFDSPFNASIDRHKVAIVRYLGQLAFQHIDAYYAHFKIEQFIKVVHKGDIPDVSHDAEAVLARLALPSVVIKAIEEESVV